MTEEVTNSGGIAPMPEPVQVESDDPESFPGPVNEDPMEGAIQNEPPPDMYVEVESSDEEDSTRDDRE